MKIILIENKTISIVLAVLTFIFGSILLTFIIFTLLGLPLSAILQNQLYVFFALLISAVFASMVYGRGSKQRALDVTDFLNNKLDLDIKDKDIARLLRLLEKFPPFVINRYVSSDIDAVKEFDQAIEENTSQLTDDDLSEIRRIIEIPIPELHNILNELYLITKLEQFKILADPKAGKFIEINLEELKKILFKNRN